MKSFNGKRTAFVISFEPGAAVIIENGRFRARGVVLGPADAEGWIKVEIFRNKIDVPLAQVRVGEMSAEKPWQDAPREMLEHQLGVMATQLAAARAESAGMLEVIAMQCDALGALQVPAVPKDQENEWYESLVDRLETYLVQLVGQRHPLAIADPALRDLVSHILD